MRSILALHELLHFGELRGHLPAERGQVDYAGERMLAEYEQQAAADMAARAGGLDKLDLHLIMLRGLGVNVSVTLHMSEDDAKHSIEVGPADRRCKIYYRDLDDLKRKLKDAREAQLEAEALRLVAPPKGEASDHYQDLDG